MARFDISSGTGLREEMILKVRSLLLHEYDHEYGGFGREPKFPHFDVLDFLLDEYYWTKNEDLAEILHTTLTNMAGGGMFDREMGGFFRYSTTQDWGTPHYEKMLDDNARLLTLYLKAFQIFNDGHYKEVALDVIMYMNEWLVDHEHGLFYGSQNGDEEYYELTRREREKFKGPNIDKTIYTNWNGFALSAYLKAFAVLDAIDCRDIALKGLDYLMKNCFEPGEGMYHYLADGKVYNTGFLEDQLAITNAILDAYEITHLVNYLETAVELAELTLERFYDHNLGGFFVEFPASDSQKQNNSERKPLTINSCMAELFLRLEVITGNSKYYEVAMKTISYCADLYLEYGVSAAPFGRAVSAAIHGFTHITIVGNFDDQIVRKLFQESLKVYSPHKVIEELDPILDQEKIERLGYDPELHQAYISKGKTSYPPVRDAEEISKVLVTI